MKLISCQNGRILTSLKSEESLTAPEEILRTGFAALDEVAPEGGFARGAIHELISDHGSARTFAMMIGSLSLRERAGVRGFSYFERFEIRTPPHPNPLPEGEGTRTGAIVYCDDHRDLYPPAVALLGIPLDRLYLLRPENPADRIWAITECLRCRGVAATIASIDQLSRIEARRLQLAAERGGGMGLLLRPMIRTRAGLQAPPIYAAATRWLVEPERGEPRIQRWKVQLIHGHGGRVGETVILEHHRETNLVRAIEKLAHRPLETGVRTVG
jgi:hypothetical protein